MKKKIEQITTLFLSIALLLSGISIPAYATDTIVDFSFNQPDINCQTYNTKEAFLDNYSTALPYCANSAPAPSISNLSISGNGSSISLEFSVDGQQQSFCGALYPVVGGGYYDDKLVLGDFSASLNYNIVSFRVEKVPSVNTTLRLILENLNNGQIHDINIELSDSQFNMFRQAASDYYTSLNIAPNSYAYVEIMQKTVSLMQIDKNWSNPSPLASATSFDYDSLSTYNTGVTATRPTLDSFFTMMDNSGRSGYTYSSTSAMGKVLNQLGWKVYHNSTAAAPYFYVSYGVDNAGKSRLVQIILCGYSTDYNRNSGCAESHMQVYGSVLVEWDTSYNVGNCKVVYYGGGPELTDIYLCSSELAGTNTIFTKSHLSFSFYSNQNPWTGFLISRIPKYGMLIVNIWNNLTLPNTAVSNWEQGYEVTVDAQVAAGGLIKDICARSRTASFLFVGNNIHLDGTVKGTYSSHKLKFRFTAKNTI